MDYITLIETAFHSKNSDQRMEGEKQLFLIATNDLNAISNLLQISKYKLEVTQFIVSLIKRKLSSQNQYPIEQRISDAECIRQALGSKLEMLYKDNLVIALSNLIAQDKENLLKEIFINQVKQLFATQQVEQIEQGLYMTQAILVEDVIDCEFFNQIFLIGQIEQFRPLWQKTINEILNNIMKPKQNYDVAQNIILNSAALAKALQVQLDYFKKQSFDLEQDILFIKIVSKLFNKLIKHKPVEFINQSVLFQQYPIITQICTNTLLKFFQLTNFDINFIQNNQLKEAVFLMLKFINLGCRQIQLFEFYQIRKVDLIFDVIFPLCMATGKDLQDIEFDPEEYIKCQQDIIKYQSSSIPQTAAADLLKSFLFLDGTTTFVFDFALSILNQAIDEQFNTDILNLIKDKYIMKQSQLQKIHLSISILCIISGFVCDRNDLIFRLTQFIEKNQAIISSNTNSVIVKLKFTQLIGSYCQQICRLSKDNFHNYLQYLLEFLSVQHQNVLIYQGVETFRIIIDTDENGKFILPILNDLTFKLCSNLQDCQYAEVFELLQEIITKYKQSITQELLSFILQSVVSKILHEHQMMKTNERNEIWLNLAFNILKMLPDQDFIPKYIDLIETSMAQIINLLQTNESIEFAEDIFVMFSGIIIQTQRITDIEFRVFILSFNVLESQCWRLGQLFELYNLIIVYGPHIFSDVPFQLQFLQILSKLTLEQNDRINEADNSESLLIFQLLLEKVQITIEGVQIIFNTLIKRSEIKIVNSFFRSRLYCTFLQLARYVQQYQIFNVLPNFQEILYKVIKELPQYLSKGYDTKLYIISLSEIVQQNHLLWNEIAISMIEKLNDQLEYEGVEETKDEDMFEINDIEAEANIILGVFLGKVLKEDEFTYFNNLYYTMQKSSPITINNQHLKKILMTQRINGKPRQVFKKKLKKQ